MRLTNIGVVGYLHSSFECLRPETINILPKKTTIRGEGSSAHLVPGQHRPSLSRSSQAWWVGALKAWKL